MRKNMRKKRGGDNDEEDAEEEEEENEETYEEYAEMYSAYLSFSNRFALLAAVEEEEDEEAGEEDDENEEDDEESDEEGLEEDAGTDEQDDEDDTDESGVDAEDVGKDVSRWDGGRMKMLWDKLRSLLRQMQFMRLPQRAQMYARYKQQCKLEEIIQKILWLYSLRLRVWLAQREKLRLGEAPNADRMRGGGGADDPQPAAAPDADRPPKQQQMRLGSFFAGAKRDAASENEAKSEEQVEAAVLKIAERVRQRKVEDEYQKQCGEDGQLYVRNGNRDRFGNLRQNKGGRPKKDPTDKVGVDGGDSSNVARPGEARRRRDLTAPERLAMSRAIDEIIAEMALKDEDGKAKHLCHFTKDESRLLWGRVGRMWPKIPVPELQWIHANQKAHQDAIQELHLSKGYGSGVHKSNVKVVGAGGVWRKNQGCRTRGAGAKNIYAPIWVKVGTFHSVERLLGHAVDKADCFNEFSDLVNREIKKLTIIGKVRALSKMEAKKLDEYPKRLEKLQINADYKKSYTNRLCGSFGGVVGVPSRYTDIKPAEELIRWKLTLQSWDCKMHLLAFGSAEDLRDLIAIPAKIMDVRSQVVLVFSDQIPFWVKIGLLKVLFAPWEKGRRSKLAPDTQSHAAPQMGQQIVEAVQLEIDAKLAEGQTQTRGPAKTGQEKFRITFEARQGVLNWFALEDPVGVVFPSIIVVYGAHCRLDNLDDDGRFIEHEEFYVAGEKVVHKQGQRPAGGKMMAYVKLRRDQPDLFKNIIVYQQPSATYDEIICCWEIADMMKRCPHGIWQRDLFAAALTDVSKLAMKIAHFVAHWILGGMTAVMQLTDTHVAFIMKAASRLALAELKRLKQIQNKQAGTAEDFSCGPYEIMVISNAAHDAIVAANSERRLVLDAYVTNGFGAYRPNLVTGKMEKTDGQEWKTGLKEGGHRVCKSWTAQRYDWLDDNGVPTQPDYSQLYPKAADPSPEMEPEHASEPKGDKFTTDHKRYVNGIEMEVSVIDLEVDDQFVLPADLADLILTDPKTRRQQQQLSTGLASKQDKEDKKMSRCKLKLAMKGFSPEMHEGLQADLKKLTRKEVFQRLVPSGSSQDRKARLLRHLWGGRAAVGGGFRVQDKGLMGGTTRSKANLIKKQLFVIKN